MRKILIHIVVPIEYEEVADESIFHDFLECPNEFEVTLISETSSQPEEKK